MSESTALDVCMGNAAGASLSVRAAKPVAQLTREGEILRGRIPSWTRVLVRTMGVGGSKRVWILEPGAEENEIRFGEFYVRGRFVVTDQSNNPRTVDRIWKKTLPEA